MYFTGNHGYQNFLVCVPVISLLTLGRNRKVTNWTSTGIVFSKIKPLDPDLKSTMSNLANGKES